MRPAVSRLLLLAAALAFAAPASARPPGDVATADAALADTFTLQGVTATQPRRADGGYDWDWRGPRDDPEWSWFFNRHEAFIDAQRAWRVTGDRRYVEWIFSTLDDWIITHPSPGRMSFSAAWRPLEAARRILGPWTVVYENLRDDPAFTAERRERFLASLHAHGEQLRHHHALFGNHLITEMLALAQLCLVFPENENTNEWLAYALGRLAREYDAQVYPDGSYKELATHYQRVVAVNYQNLLDLLVKAGRRDEARDWRERSEHLWSYLRLVQKPDGTAPVNNDSDQENVAALLGAYAPRFAGEPPRETVALPYAGQIVFRDGGAMATAHWALFDRGPYGTAHQHEDRLHFSLSIGAADFLVDNGRYTYVPGPWRDYFAGPTGHNVVMIDGHGGETGPKATDATEPPSTTLALGERWESAFGDSRFALDGNPRAADWRRIVVNLRGDGWLVIDRVVAFGPRTVETLWHWHPDCAVTPDGDTRLLVQNGGQSLLVALASTATIADLRQVRGSEDPVQGWHSVRFNQRVAATCTMARQMTGGPLLNVWFFSPGAQPAEVTIRQKSGARLHLSLTRGDATDELALDLDNPANLRWPVTPENARQ